MIKMNKRQAKKKQKKEDMFIASWAFSYKEMKKLTRDYHEFVVDVKRKKWDKVWFDNVVDAWNGIPEKYIAPIDDWTSDGNHWPKHTHVHMHTHSHAHMCTCKHTYTCVHTSDFTLRP